jgi:nicotinate-nucleotide adenylyltransferase
VELELGGESVTADTIEWLQARHPHDRFELIVGSDTAGGLGTWRRADELARLAPLVVIDRPGAIGARPPEPFVYDVVPCPLVDLSSSDLRERVATGALIDFLVPDAVREFIDEQGLYR